MAEDATVRPEPQTHLDEDTARKFEEIAFDVDCGLSAIDAMAFRIAELSDADGRIDQESRNALTQGVGVLARLLNDRFEPLLDHCSIVLSRSRARKRRPDGDAD